MSRRLMHLRDRSTPVNRAFTLIELLVCVAIITVLIAIMLPSLSKARQTAKRTQCMSGLKQVITGYTMYHQEQGGALLLGYTPSTVNGKAVLVTLPTGQTLGWPVSGRYAWRLSPFVGNVWKIMYQHAPAPPSPTAEDSDAMAFSKAYALSSSPEFGLNSVYVGGHSGPVYQGFAGPDGDTPTSTHAVYRANMVRRPAELIVFAESREKNAGGAANSTTGFFLLTAPFANGQKWDVEGDQFKVKAPSGVLMGLPEGRNGKGTVTAFFDSHVEVMKPSELRDMRYWANGATGPDYDFTGGH